jgi:hypothetical protein
MWLEHVARTMRFANNRIVVKHQHASQILRLFINVITQQRIVVRIMKLAQMKKIVVMLTRIVREAATFV